MQEEEEEEDEEEESEEEDVEVSEVKGDEKVKEKGGKEEKNTKDIQPAPKKPTNTTIVKSENKEHKKSAEIEPIFISDEHRGQDKNVVVVHETPHL